MLAFLILVYTLVQLVAGLGPTRRQLLSSSVIRRADDTELWNNAVSKGCILYGVMFASDKEAGAMFKPPLSSAQSEFHGTGKLLTWPTNSRPFHIQAATAASFTAYYAS
jgi:hypothetical protein